ncbi:MAG: hypothetical protein JXR77_08965, partial [Lentisphaeria bacterium]|nr:hypothetical protein [Lentisphaeria bacterium]
ATARTNKVRYSFHYDPADAAGMYAVRRSIDPEVNTSGNPNAGWGFYGTTAANETIGANGVPQWVSVSDARRVLVSGVEEFRIDPYPAFTGTRNILPRAFVVNVTLVDERALALPEPLRTQRLDQSRRTFRKIIFVGGEGT